MSSLSTAISRVRSEAAGGWREAPLSEVLSDTAGQPSGTAPLGQTTPGERAQILTQAGYQSFEAPSPRSPELTPVISRLLAFCESLDHGIIGISSDRHGSGVSLLTRELARGYAELGRPACLVDASRFNMAPATTHAAGAPPLDLRPLGRRHCDGYQKIDLTELPTSATFGTAEFRESLSPWINDAGVVLVDLPPVCEPDGTTHTSTITIGSACDVILLVCQTGVVRKQDFCRCLMQSRAGRLKIGGIVLNDMNLIASHLITDC